MIADRLDLHTHTLASGHAYNTIREMAQAARDRGLVALGITEHAPMMPGSCTSVYFQNLGVHPRTLNGLRLFLGVELNIYTTDGDVDLSDAEMARLDYAIASIHPFIYPDHTSVEENTRAYIRAMDRPKVKIIGHPDDGRMPVDMESLVRAAKEKHVLLELNNSSLNPEGFRKNAWDTDRLMLKLCAEQNVPIVINSDAHVAEDVGNHGRAHQLIEEMNFPEELIINTSLDRFLSFIGE